MRQDILLTTLVISVRSYFSDGPAGNKKVHRCSRYVNILEFRGPNSIAVSKIISLPIFTTKFLSHKETYQRDQRNNAVEFYTLKNAIYEGLND